MLAQTQNKNQDSRESDHGLYAATFAGGGKLRKEKSLNPSVQRGAIKSASQREQNRMLYRDVKTNSQSRNGNSTTPPLQSLEFLRNWAIDLPSARRDPRCLRGEYFEFFLPRRHGVPSLNSSLQNSCRHRKGGYVIGIEKRLALTQYPIPAVVGKILQDPRSIFLFATS